MKKSTPFKITRNIVAFCLFCLLFSTAKAQTPNPPVVQWNFAAPGTTHNDCPDGSDWIYQIIQSADGSGDYIAVGYTTQDYYPHLNCDATMPVILKLDANGNLIWEKPFWPSKYFATPDPWQTGKSVWSSFYAVKEVIDPVSGQYCAIVTGDYADQAYYPTNPVNTSKVTLYTYAVEIFEDDNILGTSGEIVPDVANTEYGDREFWSYMLVDPGLEFNTSLGSIWSVATPYQPGQAATAILGESSYNDIIEVDNPTYPGFALTAVSESNTATPSPTGMVIKLDPDFNLQLYPTWGTAAWGTSTKGYSLITNGTNQTNIRDIVSINNGSASQYYVVSGYVQSGAYTNALVENMAADGTFPGLTSWVYNESSDTIGTLASVPTFTPSVTYSPAIASVPSAFATEVKYINNSEILVNVWCDHTEQFNVQNFFPLNVPDLCGNAYGTDSYLGFQQVVLKMDPANGTLITGSSGAPNGALYVKPFEGIDFFSRILPTSDGGYAVTGDMVFNLPAIPDNQQALALNEHLGAYNDIVKFSSSDVEQWDQVYMSAVEPEGNLCAKPIGSLATATNCLFGAAATNDGGYVLAGNNRLNGEDYYALKLEPPPCSGTYTTAVGQLNSSLPGHTLPYGAVISSNTTWSGNYYVQGYVDILPGKTLTIASGANIEFANVPETGVESKIIVEPGGAILDVYGTLTSMNSCINEMWDGIELRGQTGISPAISSQAQTTANMGEVIMETGSTLSNANLGIFTMKINADQGWDNLHTGGIIIAKSGAHFVNNIESVDMQVYNYISLITHKPTNTNKSTFTGCNFITSGFPTQPVGFAPGAVVHVCLNQVHGVGLFGNTFECDETYPSCFCSTYSRGIGINSYDATYTVDETCPYIAMYTGCTGGTGNTFKDLQYGILANSDINTQPVNINNNTFTNNIYDILLDGAGASVISGNAFTKSSYGNEYTNILGGAIWNIYIENAYPYTVSGNTFSATSAISPYSTPEIWSTEITNTISNVGSSIDHNTYTGLSAHQGIIVGIQPQGENPGLTMQCNTFNSPISINDIGVLEYGTNQGTIAVQGDAIIHGSHGVYANNTFSHTSLSIITANDFYNTDPFPTANPGDPTVIYNYSPGTGPYSTNNVTATSCYSASCSTGIGPATWTASNLALSEVTYKHIADSLTHVLISGNASSLYTYISAGYTPARLQDSMLRPGPYLSDGVMNALIALNLPFDTLRNILVPNAPVDMSVQTTLNANTYYTTAQDTRIDTITGVSARTQLEQDTMFNLNEAGIYQSDVVMLYLNDTIASNIDSAINALYGMGATLNHAQLAELASLQYQDNDSTSAFSTLSTLSSMGDAMYANYCTLLPMVIHLQNEPNGVYALRSLPSDSSTIAGIAMDTLALGYAQARSLLEVVYNIQFAHPVIIDTLPGGGHHPDKRTASSTSNSPVTIDNSQFKLYPNPANSSLTIAYSLNNSTQEVNLMMYDILGNKVADWTLPSGASGNTIVNENISSLAPGMYFYTIFEDNKVVQRNKLVIER